MQCESKANNKRFQGVGGGAWILLLLCKFSCGGKQKLTQQISFQFMRGDSERRVCIVDDSTQEIR